MHPYREWQEQRLYADRIISSQVTSRFNWYAMRPRIDVSVLSAAPLAMLYGLPSTMLL